MRTAVIVFIAVGVWLPGLVHAQDSTCDAEPRYLVVTVVGSDTVRDGQRDEFFRDAGRGVYMIDRCAGEAVTIGQSAFGDRPDLADLAQATITVHYTNEVFTMYHVRESLHDICAVLAEWADATK